MARRNTPARTAVLEALRAAHSALSHEMLEQQLDGQANRATIYRILNRLTEDGVVHRVVTAEGVQYFALCTDCTQDDHQHHHLHFRCLSCERVECLKQEVVPSLPPGYRTYAVNATVSGICGACTTARPSH